jgi:hypothetical protein
MYAIDLAARGTKCIELSQVFDSQGKPITIDLYLSRAESKQGRIAVDAPQSVRIRIRDTVDGTYNHDTARRKPPVHLDG